MMNDIDNGNDNGNDMYYDKYLKYKQKYLQLKKIGVRTGGGGKDDKLALRVEDELTVKERRKKALKDREHFERRQERDRITETMRGTHRKGAEESETEIKLKIEKLKQEIFDIEEEIKKLNQRSPTYKIDLEILKKSKNIKENDIIINTNINNLNSSGNVRGLLTENNILRLENNKLNEEIEALQAQKQNSPIGTASARPYPTRDSLARHKAEPLAGAFGAAAAAPPASTVPTVSELETSDDDIRLFQDKTSEEIISHVNEKISELKIQDKFTNTENKINNKKKYLDRNKVILNSLLEEIDKMKLSIFIKKIYKQKIVLEQTVNDIELREIEVENQLNDLNEQKKHLESQIKPKTLFGFGSEPHENSLIREQIEKIDIEIEQNTLRLTTLQALPEITKLDEQLKTDVNEFIHKIKLNIANKKLREEQEKQHKLRSTLMSEIANSQSRPVIGKDWKQIVFNINSILGDTSTTDDEETQINSDMRQRLPEINDTVVNQGEEAVHENIGHTLGVVARAASIPYVDSRQSIDIKEANTQLRTRLDKLSKMLEALNAKIKEKESKYKTDRTSIPRADRDKIIDLKINHILQLNKYNDDIEKIKKESLHIEKLLKLLNQDKHVNTVKGELEKFCFPILYQEFEHIYNLESVKNIIQKRIQGFNITDRVERASSETPLTLQKVKSIQLPSDELDNFSRWVKNKEGINYDNLTIDELKKLYEEFKKRPTDRL